MEPAYREGHILVIEDDQDAQANLRDILEMDGYAIETARSMSEALTHSRIAETEVILLDRRLPEGNALDFLSRLRRRAPDAALVVVTAHSDLEGVIEALRHGAADYILKPINPDSLRIRIGRLLERRLALAKERGDSVFRNLVAAAECMIVMLRPEDHAILYDENEAFRRLQRLASERNRKLVEIATMILTAEKAFQPVEKAKDKERLEGRTPPS